MLWKHRETKMADLKQFAELKSKVEQAQQRMDRAQGSLDQLMKQLKEDFDCKTIEEATAKLKKLKKEESSIEEEFTEAMEKFNEKWQEKL